MKDVRVKDLTPRYKFILNPYDDFRLSKCPLCEKLTHMRKFALGDPTSRDGDFWRSGRPADIALHVSLVITHQDELEDELVGIFENHAPEVIGNPYMAIGTVDKKLWKQSLGTRTMEQNQALQNLAPFKDVLTLKMEGGWQPVIEP